MKPYLLILVAALCFSVPLAAQWTPTNGPLRPFRVTDIFSIDSSVLAATACDIFESTDNGNSWSNLGPNYTSTSSAFFQGNIYLVGTTINKVQGSSHALTISTVNYASFSDIYADTDNIYAASQNRGCEFSADGTNWSISYAGLPDDTVFIPVPPYYQYQQKTICISGNDQYLFTGTKYGVYKALKSDLQWSAGGNGSLPVDTVTAVACRDSVVLVAIDNKIYRSTDHADNFATTLTLSFPDRIKDLENIHDTLFAATRQSGLWISYDLGITWAQANTNLGSLNVDCIHSFHSGFFLGTNEGIFKGLPAWSNTAGNIVCSNQNMYATTHTDSCIAVSGYDRVWVSHDEGQSWINSTAALPVNMAGQFAVGKIVNVNNCLFVTAVDPSMNCRSWLSTDHGQTWINKTVPFSSQFPLGLASNGSKVIAFNATYMYISADSGSTWSNIFPGSPAFCYNKGVYSGTSIFMVYCNPNGIMRSYNEGFSWMFQNNGLPGTTVYNVGLQNGIVLAATYSGLYRSTDMGQSWQATSYTSGNSAVVNITDFASDAGRIYFSTSQKVYASADMGATWFDISYGLPPLPAFSENTSLTLKDNFLYYSTGMNGVWKLDTTDPAISVQQKEPVKAELLIYPNPTDGRISLQGITINTIKEMYLIDPLGKVTQPERTADGIDLSHMENGMYLLKIRLDDDTYRFRKVLKTK